MNHPGGIVAGRVVLRDPLKDLLLLLAQRQPAEQIEPGRRRRTEVIEQIDANLKIGRPQKTGKLAADVRIGAGAGQRRQP